MVSRIAVPTLDRPPSKQPIGPPIWFDQSSGNKPVYILSLLLLLLLLVPGLTVIVVIIQ